MDDTAFRWRLQTAINRVRRARRAVDTAQAEMDAAVSALNALTDEPLPWEDAS